MMGGSIGNVHENRYINAYADHPLVVSRPSSVVVTSTDDLPTCTSITAQSWAWYPSRRTSKSAEEDTNANRYCTSTVPAAGVQPGTA
jgi:hypothetical protein